MAGSYVIEKMSNGMHGIAVPQRAVAKLKNEKRVCCTINGYTFHCALLRQKNGYFYIYISQAIRKKIGADAGTKVSPEFTHDHSEHKFKEVVEFTEVLKTDAEAESVFNALTEGNKRSLLYLASQPRTVGKRIERALLIANRLRQGITTARLILRK